MKTTQNFIQNLKEFLKSKNKPQDFSNIFLGGGRHDRRRFNEMEILKLTRKNRKSSVKIIARLIKEGKIVVCPTDTVYGLLCDATSKKAIDRLFKIKKREKGKFFPIFVKDLKTAKALANIESRQEKILKKFWPGKLTAVLKRNRKLKIYGLDKKTIALRIPKHKLIKELLVKSNLSLTGTSGNISGQPTSTKIKDIIRQFKNQKFQPDLIIDAGNLPKSLPSTIIDLTGREIKTLRKGAVKFKLKNLKT
ncbi:MAG: threonylcarbamoyl-AMP synthase [Candidatus Nealsonbacteria bacterium CG_4_10_14_0_2_um_filter_38_17]|uniref:L-threonylcarbamoyladenylate synthase n=2 Tax=Candidatus Nealsoniibacteriota TaxID=1817911 RepID=A0A2M7UXM6_9BACT|nr:MAG: threonylcarbamoyl-AMP synthase [Candidatus Nealsonbacteria bacterium CG23_combo_of_CG06-09_8_20_14_all_38_19]PIZ88615.1 MAG: threonylcarbamoyl-AMP synthase [Candidatus Nealsonbacteria bacterium CG_4_10_14_0_2_um_filter_38_17]